MDKSNERKNGVYEINQVWKLVDISKGLKVIRNKWALKIKCKADNTIKKYKVRQVIKDYTKQEGINWGIFFLIIRFTSIHLILTIITSMDLELHQMDVKTTFLNGDLEEEIYM